MSFLSIKLFVKLKFELYLRYENNSVNGGLKTSTITVASIPGRETSVISVFLMD